MHDLVLLCIHHSVVTVYTYVCIHFHDFDCASEQLEEANAAKEGEAALRRKAEEGYLELKEKVNTSTTNAKHVLIYVLL